MYGVFSASHFKRIAAAGSAMALFCVLAAPPAFCAAELGEAKKLYLTKCSKCHKLYDPAGYDDISWDGWMVKMKKKSHLNDGQYEKIRSYLETLRKK